MRIKVVTVDIELSRNTKRAIRWLVLPIAVFFGTVAVAYAYDASWITAGAPVQASKLKAMFDEIQTRIVALEGSQPVDPAAPLLVTSSVNTNNPNDAFEEVAVVCPGSKPLPMNGGCYATANVQPPALYGSFPFRNAKGDQGWICRFEPVIGESYYAFALCTTGTISPAGAFPTAGL